MPIWHVDPTTSALHEMIFDIPGYAPDGHWSGSWIQSDAELPGGDLGKQWVLRSSYDWTFVGTGVATIKQGIGFYRADGSDARFLAHNYTSVWGGDPGGTDSAYWSLPRATTSPDGKIVIFGTNMLASGRYDVFAAEVPIS